MIGDGYFGQYWLASAVTSFRSRQWEIFPLLYSKSLFFYWFSTGNGLPADFHKHKIHSTFGDTMPTQLLTQPRRLALAMLVLTGAPAAQAETTFITSLGFQNKQLNFDQRYSGSLANQRNKADFSVHMPMFSAGATMAIDKFFFAVKVETDLAESPVRPQETNRSLFDEANLLGVRGSEVNVSRQDYSLTAGYNVWEALNLFVGYLEGETELTPAPFCADPLNINEQGQIETPCQQQNRAFMQFIINQPRYRQTYKENGPFLGGSYTFRFEDLGALSLSVAYASMSGSYSDNANDPHPADSPAGHRGTFVAFNYKGDTTGTSLSATWTGSLGDYAAYYVDLRRQAYNMSGNDVTGLPNFSGVSLKTEEEMLGLTGGVQFYF